MNTLNPNEKLPLGSYFYIKVGPHFYSGEKPNTVIVKDVVPVATARPKEPSRRRKLKGYKPNPKKDFFSRSKAKIRDVVAPNKPTDIVHYIGDTSPIMTNDVTEVKRFRRRSQAEKVCENLTRVYASLGVKPTIELSEGDNK